MAFCYKDRTWCSSDCVNHTCPRFLSEKERNQAEAWWAEIKIGGGVPYAFSDFSKGCTAYMKLCGA